MSIKTIKEITGFLNTVIKPLLLRFARKNGKLWQTEFKKFLEGKPCWVKGNAIVEEVEESVRPPAPVKESLTSILTPVAVIDILATTLPFVADSKFNFYSRPESSEGTNQIHVSGNFRDWFIGFTEKPIMNRKIHSFSAERDILAIDAVGMFGGSEKAYAINLTEIYQLIERQGSSEGHLQRLNPNYFLVHNNFFDKPLLLEVTRNNSMWSFSALIVNNCGQVIIKAGSRFFSGIPLPKPRR